MLQKMREYARLNFVPIVRPKTAEMLVEKVKETNPKNILEIGTAIGYSGILMLQNSNANLITLEIDEKIKKIAEQNFVEAGVEKRVEIVLGDCKDYIVSIKQSFDFIFLDGPKSHYVDYLPFLLERLTENGMIFADNVLFQGLVKKSEEPPKKFRTIVRKLRQFINEIESNENLNVKVIDVEDGVAIIKKK